MISLPATARAGAPIADIDRRLFGGFVEHLGRHIYADIYAANTLSDPLRVVPVPVSVTVTRGDGSGDGSCVLHVQLPRVSWTAIQLT